jgi:DNA-directed RNA polymerase alpha subunit
MNPKIENVEESNNVMRFRLSGVNVSLSNALRRTIISDIPTVVFKTSPYEENKATIISNTSRLNNEVIKQRLSCIPIYIDDLNVPFQNLIMEVNEVNETDSIMYVTTEHFKLKDKTTNTYLSEKETRVIFPTNSHTNYYIDFVRLRPKISDELPGEKLHMTCDLSIGTCKEDGMFNVVSTCAYGFTQDLTLIEIELAKKLQTWRDAGMKIEEIEFEKKNWLLLDAFRLTVPDSFEFIIESVGVFSFKQLITTACNVLKERLTELNNIIESNELSIEPSQNTMANCYDITLENEDYTIGKMIEYMLYTFFYENGKNVKKNEEPLNKKMGAPANINTLTYCGFKKFHPHDSHSIIRVAYKTRTNPSIIKGHLQLCIAESIKVYTTIMQYF